LKNVIAYLGSIGYALVVIDESKMMLAVDMDGCHTVSGWLASEKLNGCRAYWDGTQFWTRGGNVIDAPKWFTEKLPKMHLDGEIHAGRGTGFRNANTGYKASMTAVIHGKKWFTKEIKFTAFDAPQVAGNWLERLAAIPAALRIESVRITDILHFVSYLTNLRKLGAEGAMFRNPATGYETGRTENLLRFKYEE
jgi:DNA ligase-1